MLISNIINFFIMKTNILKEPKAPNLCEWKIQSEKKVQELTKYSGKFRRVKATMQTAENPDGETVYGWITEYGSGHIFVPYNKDTALNSHKYWFENISPL